MRRITLVVLAVALVGCAEPMSKTQRGTAIGTGTGAAVGAGLGQLIGGDTRSTLIGAGVGAALGGVTGGVFSNYMEKQEQEMRQSLASVEGASIQRDAQTLAVTFKSDLLFDVDSAVVKAGGYDELKRVADVLNAYPQTRLQIAGHTDSTGSETYNQSLSERRAEAVKGILSGYQVAPQRMSTIGFGESKPIASNDTLSGRQMNRRVAITIEPLQQAQNTPNQRY
ncbi:MAG: OmpA family protein [Desulfuromonadaceae bacterium]|nr:OmpA family protein [Desulfuromonas sp.]MDY0184956.1 OmpA family protein [Desulfuromonadaceae bacterium]